MGNTDITDLSDLPGVVSAARMSKCNPSSFRANANGERREHVEGREERGREVVMAGCRSARPVRLDGSEKPWSSNDVMPLQKARLEPQAPASVGGD